MQAIILTAEKDSRTFPLTVNRPKALLRAANKSILEHTLDCLTDLVDEALIVVGFKKEMIMEKIGSEYSGIPVKYIELQEPWLRTAALKQAESLIRERFILLNSDYLYDRKELAACLQHEKSILVNPVDSTCSCYVLEKSFLSDLPGNIEDESSDDRVLTEALGGFARDRDIFTRKSEKWLPIIYPWSLLEANENYLANIECRVEGRVEPQATIKGEVIIGRGTIVKNGAYIQGPVIIGENCTIGPNCFIRAFTAVGYNCTIGNAVEIKNSIIGDNVNVCHLSYLGDSIIGEGVNIGAGNISANLRHDNRSVVTLQDGEKVDTKRRKLGVIIGDHVHTGINNSFYPGRKIWPYLSTLPGEIIKEDRIG